MLAFWVASEDLLVHTNITEEGSAETLKMEAVCSLEPRRTPLIFSPP
jgi:hypothetical protein